MMRKIAFSFILCVIVWLSGLAWFITQIPSAAIAETITADAIVVLTGGSGRLSYGLQLLAENRGKKLFVTGVGEASTITDLLHQASPTILPILQPIAEQSIILGRQAVNTIGNAEEAQKWLKSENYKSILLVTANYHMPRSLEEFQETIPDITIIPAPVFPQDFTLAGWWLHRESRILVLSEYHKYMAAEARHWLVTNLRKS